MIGIGRPAYGMVCFNGGSIYAMLIREERSGLWLGLILAAAGGWAQPDSRLIRMVLASWVEAT